MDIAGILEKTKSTFSSLFRYHPLPVENKYPGLTAITQGLEEEDLAVFLQLGTEMDFNEGDFIFKEHDPADCLYIILLGEAEVIKNTTNHFGDEHLHVMAILKEEDVFGDMALIESKPRSAAIRAKTPLKVLHFYTEEIRKHTTINLALTKNLATILSKRLRYTNDVTVKKMEESLEEAKARNVLGVFMVAIFWLISLYTLSLTSLIKFKTQFSSSTPLSVGLIAIFALVIVMTMRKTGIPLARFGITMDNWRAKSLEALLYTLPFMILFLLIKVDLVYFSDNPHHLTVFSALGEYTFDGKFDSLLYFLNMFAYSVFSPIQELVTRCALQTTFFLFLPGTEMVRKWNSIILSNLIFSAVHSHMNLTFAIAAFVPGLFWGWLFHKQRSLFAVSVSHIALGVWVLFIIGVEGIV